MRSVRRLLGDTKAKFYDACLLEPKRANAEPHLVGKDGISRQHVT